MKLERETAIIYYPNRYGQFTIRMNKVLWDERNRRRDRNSKVLEEHLII